MANPIFRQFNPWLKLLVFVLLAIFSTMFVGALSMIVISMAKGWSLEEIQMILSNVTEDNASVVLYLNTLSIQIGLFLIPCLLFVLFFGRNSVNNFWFRPPGTGLIIGVFAMIFAMPLIESLISFNAWLIPEGSYLESVFKSSEMKIQDLTDKLLIMPDMSTYIRNVILIAVFPAFAEELVFRGVIQSQIAKHTNRIHLSIWFSAFLFSFIHLQFYGFIPRLMLGAFFGYLLIWTGSIWTPILAHFLNNFIGVSLVYFTQDETGGNSAEEIETLGTQAGVIIFAVVLFTISIVYLIRLSKWEGIKEGYYYDESEGPFDPNVLDSE